MLIETNNYQTFLKLSDKSTISKFPSSKSPD